MMDWSPLNVLLVLLLVQVAQVPFLVTMVVAAKEETRSLASQRGALSPSAVQQWRGECHGGHRLCVLVENLSRELKLHSNRSCRYDYYYYHHRNHCQLLLLPTMTTTTKTNTTTKTSSSLTTTHHRRSKWLGVCMVEQALQKEGTEGGKQRQQCRSAASRAAVVVRRTRSSPSSLLHSLELSRGDNKLPLNITHRKPGAAADGRIEFTAEVLRSFVSLPVSGGWTPRLLLTTIDLRKRRGRTSIGLTSSKKNHRQGLLEYRASAHSSPVNTEVCRLRQKRDNSERNSCFLLRLTTASSYNVGQTEAIRREKTRQGGRRTTTPLIAVSAALAGGFSTSSSTAAGREKMGGHNPPSVSREDDCGFSGPRQQCIRRHQLPALQVSPKEGVSFSAHRPRDCLKVGIVRARWNPKIVDSLEKGVREALASYSEGVVADISTVEVPGSYELPLATKWLCLSGEVDAVIAIGCLVKGETMHFEYISDSVSHGLMNVQLNTQVPVVFGVLSVLNLQQAEARSSGPDNHGVSWGHTAVEMALLRKAAMGEHSSRREIGFSNEAKTSTELSTTNGSGLSSADLAAQQADSAQERGFPSERLFRKEDDDDDASKQWLPRKAPQWYF